jgi:signal transduction histidine kinase
VTAPPTPAPDAPRLPTGAGATLPGPDTGPSFKRVFVVPGVLLTAAEALFVIWPAIQLFEPTSSQRQILWRAAPPVLVAASLLWLAAMASWLAPVQRAVSARRRAEPVDPDVAAAAYRALTRVPLRALFLRLGLWIGVAVAMGALLSARTGFPPERIATLGSMVALHAYVLATARSAWLARLAGKLREALFPGVEPLQQFQDRYFPRVLLVALLVGAGGAGALAAFLYYFIPVRTDEYLLLLTVLPGSLALSTIAWYAVARWRRRPIDRYLRAQLREGERRFAGAPDAIAIAAYQRAQLLPYQLAGARVVCWALAAAVTAGVGRWWLRLEIDNVVLMFGAAVVIFVGSALYEAIWHRTTMRPLLQHLAARHRLPVRDIRTALSLRAKLLISFGGLVLFACGLSLFWGFVQYKNLVTSFGQTQARLNLSRMSSEVQARIVARPTAPPAVVANEVVLDAGQSSTADGAVYYFVPAGRRAPTSAGGGPMGAPQLPWYALARVRAYESGSLEVDSLGLSGNFQAVMARVDGELVRVGTLAVMYPGYRGRGPGIQRPLKELLVFFLVLFGVCGGIVVLTVGEFTTPIRLLEQRADEMARGELSRSVSAGGEGDEVGRLTFALEEMRRALRDKLRSTEEVNLDLEREVQRRTADLARKNRELADALEKLTRAQSQLVRAEKMASIGQLVAGIAHEINNPVNAIVNTVNPLQEAVDDVANEALSPKVKEISSEIKDMVRVIQSGAQRTKQIVQALHNYSRTDDERIVDFDLNKGLDESLELLRHLLKGGITVERKYGNVGRIRGHAGQINQVFMNLLTNAAQALAGRDGAKIELATERSGDGVVIRVADNGPGIPPEILPRIFDPFFTTKDVGQGTGLGLSIVHGIVERHGGSIEVDSEVGQGTVFTVTLPVEPPRYAPKS